MVTDPDPAAHAVAQSDAERAIAALSARGWTIAVAESLTGGLLGAALTAVPGSSSVFRGGVTAYASELKARLLGVELHLLRTLGPVSAPTALAMAVGVRERLGADCGLSTTGVAGPGPAGGHPAGEVHLGCAWPGGTRTVAVRLTGDRTQVRAGSVRGALRLLLDAVAPPPPGGEQSAGGGPAR